MKKEYSPIPKKEKNYSRHHRKPVALGGKTNDRNISIITEVEHRAWHSLFSCYDPHTIASIINDVFLDPDYKFVVIKSP